MTKLTNGWFGLMVFGIGLLLLHLPFIDADPNMLHSTGRGAFTDEGLYTAQARNFIHQGIWDTNNSDALVKTPLFQAYLLIPFLVFGTKIYVARLCVLLTSVFLFIFICKKYHYTLLAYIGLAFVFCQFYIFQYLQFSMAEMLSVVCVFVALVIANHAVINKSYKQLFWAVLVINGSFYLKIQFINSLVIIPFYLFILWVSSKNQKNVLGKMFGWSLCFNLIFVIGFCIIWYLPNFKIINYVINEQAKAKFTPFCVWPIRAQELIKQYFWSAYTWPWSIVILLVIAVSVSQFKTLKESKYKHLLSLVAIWVLIESQKLTMHYAPSRYFIALYFGLGIFCTICLTVWLSSNFSKWKFGVVLVLLCLVNSGGIYTLLSTRTFAMRQIDNYLALSNFSNKVILGTWAASVSWQTNARTLPIWDNYFNYQKPLELYKPKLLILEQNEIDCDHLFERNQINLAQISDSVTSFQIGNWPINLYWLKQNNH